MDYIPSKDADFDKWAKNLLVYVKSKTVDFKEPEWPDIPYEHVNELNEAFDEWHIAYERTLVPHTPGVTVAKNDARAKAEKVIRAFVKRYLHFPPRTNEDLVNMGLRPRDTVRTPHIEVHELVEFEIDLRGRRELKVDFWVKNSAGKAKPQGYDGAVIVWQISGTPLVSPEKFANHAMASRTSHILYFDAEDRGKTVYIALAWQNARGHLGHWSKVQSAIIP